jgi:hemerythrin
MSDALTDNQHRDIFILANLLISSVNREEVTKNIQLISRHVKEHVKEHHVMLQKLAEIDYKIIHDDWTQSDIQEFMDKWGKHIINADMAFNVYLKGGNVAQVING